jgi:hypothetical protein
MVLATKSLVGKACNAWEILMVKKKSKPVVRDIGNLSLSVDVGGRNRLYKPTAFCV